MLYGLACLLVTAIAATTASAVALEMREEARERDLDTDGLQALAMGQLLPVAGIGCLALLMFQRFVPAGYWRALLQLVTVVVFVITVVKFLLIRHPPVVLINYLPELS